MIRNPSFLLSLMFIVACSGSKKSVYSLEKADAVRRGLTSVTVQDFTGLDGCTFLLVLDDSTRFEPINLADSLKKNHLLLWINYKTESGYMSNCMGGKAVRLTEVRYRKP